MREKKNSVYRLVFVAMMAAVVCVVTLIYFPLLGSKVRFANAMCLLSGLLLGPVNGGLAAGLGSALYDALWGGYDPAQCAITFVSKFAMAAVCALLAGTFRGGKSASAAEDAAPSSKAETLRLILACWVGAFSYVALYMLKTFVYQAFVYGYPMDAVWATMLSKLPASTINAVFAALVTPAFYAALRVALKRAGILDRLR